MKSLYWWDYTSKELGELAPGCVVFQPVASVEQHGPHLPVATDSFICQAFVDALREKLEEKEFPALFLPFMAYGKSNEHLDYPGTITYSAETFMSVLMDIGRSVARTGVKKFVFINAHGGNSEVLDIICRELRIETGMQVFALNPLIRMNPDTSGVRSEKEKRIGIHAGREETSFILYLRPDTVRKELMNCDYSVDFEGFKYIDYSGKVAFGWMTHDVTRTGTIGDTAGANAEEVPRMLEEVTEMMSEACDEILRFEFVHKGERE